MELVLLLMNVTDPVLMFLVVIESLCFVVVVLDLVSRSLLTLGRAVSMVHVLNLV